MKSLSLSFNSHSIHVSRDAWFNATDMANAFGRKPYEWLRLPETNEYLNALTRNHKEGLSLFIKTKKGKNGGTWFHRKLVIAFARWLSADFAVWCDERIEEMLSGDWQKERNDTKASYRLMSDMLQQSRIDQGKETKTHHYSNEARLISYALTGDYSGFNRDKADKHTLSAIKRLETYNSVLILMNKPYAERKALLWEKATPYRHSALLGA